MTSERATYSVLTSVIRFFPVPSACVLGPLELGHFTAQPLQQLIVGIRTVPGQASHIGILGRRRSLVDVGAIVGVRDSAPSWPHCDEEKKGTEQSTGGDDDGEPILR